MNPRVALAIAIFLATAAVYWPARGHDWLNYDDPIYVIGNPMVSEGLSAQSAAWAFTSFHGANWFPLTRLSWMLDAEISGLDAGAFVTTSVLLHALASSILFLALARMTESSWKSAFVAAVFALHPLHVEPVAWISARKDPLSGLFFALALLVYERLARRGSSPARQLALLACLGLGLMAKPVLVTLPFVLLLLDAWPLRRLGDGRPADARGGFAGERVRDALLEKLPSLALVAIFCAVTLAAQSSGGVVASVDQVGLAARVANALVSYVVYLRQAFVPTGLAVFYPHPGSVPAATALGALALLAVVTALCLRAWKSVPALAVGWLWYAGVLVPVIGLVQVGSQAHADRYTYLPLIGLAIAVAWGVPALAARIGADRRVVAGCGVAAVAGLAVVTSLQLRHWRDSAALFEHALEVTSENHIAHAHLGQARLAAGSPGKAVAEWREALRIRPDFEIAANNLAWLLATSPDPSIRHPADAVRFAERADELTGGSDPGVLDTVAAAYASARRFEDAVRTQERAVAVAREAGAPELAAALAKRLPLYRAGRAYVEGDPEGGR